MNDKFDPNMRIFRDDGTELLPVQPIFGQVIDIPWESISKETRDLMSTIMQEELNKMLDIAQSDDEYLAMVEEYLNNTSPGLFKKWKELFWDKLGEEA